MSLARVVAMLLAMQASPDAADPCHPTAQAPDDAWLATKLAADPRLAPLARDAETYRLQVLVSEVHRDAAGRTSLVRHGYRVGAEAVYPASAIKTFASVASLRALARLPATDRGAKPTRDTPLRECSGTPLRCRKPTTVGLEIRKTQIVSDNTAFNRLYNFVGHRELNDDLAQLGFPDVYFFHRLSTQESLPEHRRTPAAELRLGRERVEIPAKASDLDRPPPLGPRADLGQAHVDAAGVVQPIPFDLGSRNIAPICALHRLTIALVAPDLSPVDLGLSADDREFLLAAMTIDPHASTAPVFRSPAQTVDRFKPMLPGLTRIVPATRLRYVNKAGKAYGFHLDNAYIEDTTTGRAFFVTATIYGDRDGVVGDNRYNYSEVTVPFMADLGEVLATAILAPSPGPTPRAHTREPQRPGHGEIGLE